MSKDDIQIREIQPFIGIPGGDVTIYCDGVRPLKLDEDGLHFCGSVAMIEGASTHKLVAHIPEQITDNRVFIVQNGEIQSNVYEFVVPECVGHTLHNVGNPAVVDKDTLFATFSGTKGQITPASVFRIYGNGDKVPIISGLMNATSLLAGRNHRLYISSRYDGKVYVSDYDGNYEVFSQGLGEAFGMAMDSKGNLLVGDRTGTVFRVNEDGHADFLARLPASSVAYHLAIDSRDNLYVTAPLHIGENTIYRINPDGEVEEYIKELAEFYGIAIDADDNLYVAETNRGKGSILMIDRENRRETRLVSGEEIVGLTFSPAGDLYLATFSKIYRVRKAHLDQAVRQAARLEH